MAKSMSLLFLSVYFVLQLISAHRLQDDAALKELQQSQTVKSSEVNFVKALEPVIAATLDGVNEYLKTLLEESARFVADVLKELKTLPQEDAYIRELIPRLTNILERLTDTHLTDRSSLIRNISDMYEDFDNILKRKDDDKKVNVLQRVFNKFQLLELNWRVQSSVDSAARKFQIAFERFWDSLSAAQQKEHQQLGNWYARFKADNTSKDKLTGLKEFLQMALELVPIKEK